MYPLKEEIRLNIFGSPDQSVFLIDLWTDGDLVYSREKHKAQYMTFAGSS